jgi:hypothetical protein
MVAGNPPYVLKRTEVNKNLLDQSFVQCSRPRPDLSGIRTTRPDCTDCGHGGGAAGILVGVIFLLPKSLITRP